MTENTAPDWVKGTNIPNDAVQYWGKCKKCEVIGFVSSSSHKCCRCNTLSASKKKDVEKVAEKKEEPKPKPEPEPKPDDDKCPTCNGVGTVDDYGEQTCATCGGIGKPKEESKPETKGEGVDDREDQ